MPAARETLRVGTDWSFGSEAQKVLARLRQACQAVIAAIPGAAIRRPADLARALGLETWLAWRMFKFADTADPFAAAEYIPGERGVRLFVRAAKKNEAAVAVVAEVGAAYAAWQDFMRTYAGDRKSLRMMLAGHVTDDSTRAELEHRKLAFLGNSCIWGVQARAHVRTWIVQPSAEDPRFFDAVRLEAYVDLCRVRPNVPWRVYSCITADDAGVVDAGLRRTPLAADLARAGVPAGLPLLPEFCTPALPEFQRNPAPAGVAEFELVGQDVGRGGTLTCVTGELLRRAEPRYRDPTHQELGLFAARKTPCEVVIHDLLLHRATFGEITPRVELYSELFAGPEMRYSAADRLPCSEAVERLEVTGGALRVREMPRYTELVAFALKRLGWDAGAFDAFRVRQEYPAIPTSLAFRHPLPEAPAS